MKSKLYSLTPIILMVTLIVLSPIVGFAQMNRAAQSNNAEFIKGTIVIKVKEGIGPFEMQKSNISFGISSLDKKAQTFAVTKLEKRFKHKPIAKNSGLPDLSRIYRIEFSETQNIHQVVKAFASDPNIEYAEAVPIAHAADVPNDPMYNSQQHLPQIMASEAWDVHKGEDGEEVIIAIIDTGVDWLHPDLTENCWQNLGEDADGDGVTLEFNDGVWERDPDDLNGIDDDGNGFVDDVIGWDFLEFDETGFGSNPDPKWGDNAYQHGTHCAGIASGQTNNDIGISSISYNVTYMATKVDNNDSFIYAWDGIIYAAENGADIISNSWGGPNYSEVGRETVEYAVGLGSIIVCAGGNDNTDVGFYPAEYVGSLSVASVNPDDIRANDSHYGKGVDIAAPGVSILSTLTNNGYASWNGTSMATPMVAGLIGLLKSYQPDWTNDQLIEQIIGTTDNIDDLNPGYEKALGSGRINAYHVLVDENVVVPQELRLEFLDYSVENENGDGIVAAGETGTISISMRNYAHLVSDENATISISSLDPDIEIINGTNTAAIPADSEFEMENVFEFKVAEGAKAHYADFIITVSSDLPVIYGSETEIGVLVAPSGFFVWDGLPDFSDYSGAYFMEFFEERGYPALFTYDYPPSFNGFDAVFLSFGNSGTFSTRMDDNMADILIDYMENGGYVYLEGADILGYHQIDNTHLQQLFGLASAEDGDVAETPIEMLSGQDEALTNEMLFTSSSQGSSKWVDIFEPNDNGVTAFVEEDYGIVGVQNHVPDAQRTFCFSYALAYLDDADPHSSRYNLMIKIMEHFGFPEENSGVTANFSVDKTEGIPNLEVQFTDWSITGGNVEITGYAWDFNGDGIYDSYEQNPMWTYIEGGVFDVKLVVSSDFGSDTLVKKDLISSRSGILVYEGKPNENGYSGTFIYEYLLSHSYDEVGYTNTLPSSLTDYDVVFVSLGNTGMRSTVVSDQMESSLFSYSVSGGKTYIEGGDAMNSMTSSIWVFGLGTVENGEKNEISAMSGNMESLTDGLEFNGTNQLSMRSIDIYGVSESIPGAVVAFEENDYGPVAIEFDGSQVNGQKTFCMSYALAELEDGEGMNTRNELLSRILNFFDVVSDVAEADLSSTNQIKVYPNPTSNELTISGLAINSEIQLTDLSGNLVMTRNSGNGNIQLNISSLPNGIYILRTKDGVKKIVKM